MERDTLTLLKPGSENRVLSGYVILLLALRARRRRA